MEGERKGEERRWKKGEKSVGTRKRELIPSGLCTRLLLCTSH